MLGKKLRLLNFTLIFLALLSPGVSAPVIEATEYFVALDNRNASDNNNGLSLDQPFKTLGRGSRSLSAGDTLTILEGVYREVLEVRIDGTASQPVVVRTFPEHEGRVIIRGSDVVSGWTTDEGDIWSVPWQPLPPIRYPPVYPHVDEYAIRREIVFFNGSQLQQVLSAAELVEGSFWMDDAAGRLRIQLASDPNAGQLEVTTRSKGMFARGRDNIVVRGIRVEHVSTELWIGALALGNRGRVEDCWVEFNNGHGITMDSNAVILRTVVNNNGRIGINLAGSNGSLIDSSETSYNSWRYGPVWDAGGIKLVSVGTASGNRIVKHTARLNNGPGIFIDTVASGNVIEASVMEENTASEILIEAAIGPNWIVNNLILNTNNDEHETPSIRLLVSRDTYILNNTVVNQGGSSIFITGTERHSGAFHNYCANTHVFNNILSVHPGPRAIDFGVGGLSSTPENLASHHFDNNLYFGSEPMFWLKGPFALAEWQVSRGQDLNSISESPMFSNPSIGDYSLHPMSPAIDAGRDFPEVTEDIRGTSRPLGLRTDIGAFERPSYPPGSTRGPNRRVKP